jgi:ABC-type nitrate/sulfonate/bicarbonate transport system substrate-binding protein
MNLHLRIAGVPEHFNLPWNLAIQKGLFLEADIELEWIENKGGTGAMSKALRDESIDLAVMLTEGIVLDIANGNPSRIIAQYIDTPLTWGIHTGMKNSLQSGDDIFTKQFAISRFGSGSHLMPIIDAQRLLKQIDEKQFSMVRNLEGAINSLSALETDVFYWERSTTKPFVDKGILRCIGTSLTPWPCFVIAARNEVIQKHADALKKVLAIIQSEALRFKQSESAVDEVCRSFYLKENDAKKWLQETVWSNQTGISAEVISMVLDHLRKAGILQMDCNAEQVSMLL